MDGDNEAFAAELSLDFSPFKAMTVQPRAFRVVFEVVEEGVAAVCESAVPLAG